MINLSVTLTDPRTAFAHTSSTSTSQTAGSQSFASQLSEALSEALAKMGIDPSSVQLTVDDSAGQSNVTSQNPVAASNPVPASTTAATTDPDDAYWAKQPAAVQQLRYIKDESQRAALGMQLASEGYTIDYPIMIEGWDPQIATQIRQAAGYTWVPSALQAPVPVAPGINFPGLPSYNPNDPPPGSILVS